MRVVIYSDLGINYIEHHNYKPESPLVIVVIGQQLQEKALFIFVIYYSIMLPDYYHKQLGLP